jgi:putative aldouronate transport system substrate-binding protein
MKGRKLVALLVAVMMLGLALSGCAGSPAASTSAPAAASASAVDQATVAPSASVAASEPATGGDNNGRPYNLTPTKYDTRDQKYLYGINATKLPIVDKPITITVWWPFSSTIMKGLDECAVFPEMEKRTGIHVEFQYPTVGQETDNFNLKISSNDLPDFFFQPPEYKGGFQKAIADGVYADVTPYYDKGLMPNIKWLRENNPDFNKDIQDDAGKLCRFPDFDVVSTAPWSGMWVRQDWVDSLGLQVPKTIQDWDKMLRAMKAAKNLPPLEMNIALWYGVATNYAFAGSYETGYDFINKDGKAEFGPILPGYKEFLTLMNSWYKDGILDPDFATRTQETYNAQISSNKVGAFGMAYGDLDQLLANGKKADPNFTLTPVLQPTAVDGQTIHLHQNNARVRTNTDYMTTKPKADGIDEICVKWKDYWYSQDGGDLVSYGPEGVSYKWNADGTYSWIFPQLKNDKNQSFWTIMPLFKIHVAGFLRNSAAYDNPPGVQQCIDLWATQPNDWLVPDNITPTPDESTELASIMTDINTYRDEMTLKFIMGQEPLANFDKFVEKIKSMNIDRAIVLKQAALDRYNGRK